MKNSRFLKLLFVICVSLRPDRDQFVRIFEDNVRMEKIDNFDKKTVREIDSLGQDYDYASIMHYRRVCITIFFHLFFI